MKLTMEQAKDIMEKYGGCLDLSGTKITSLPDNLTVGGLYLSGTQITDKEKEIKRVKLLHDGEYVPGKYLYADGILTHVKSRHKINGYIFYRVKIKGMNVVSDGKYFAHCDKMRDGVADILFKKAEDRGRRPVQRLAVGYRCKP